MKMLHSFSEIAYALLRIVSGFMFMFHGVQKIFGMLTSSPTPPVGSQMWIGGLIELICGFLVMVGYKASWSAFLASGTMAVAYAQFHWKFQGGEAFLPIVNRGELAALYCLVFFYIACRGGGRWCLDKK